MKTFVLDRLIDETGISGTGIVAEGVQFSNGKCVLTWLTQHTSVAVYDSIEDISAVHGHNGKTLIRFVGSSTEEAKELLYYLLGGLDDYWERLPGPAQLVQRAREFIGNFIPDKTEEA